MHLTEEPVFHWYKYLRVRASSFGVRSFCLMFSLQNKLFAIEIYMVCGVFNALSEV